MSDKYSMYQYGKLQLFFIFSGYKQKWKQCTDQILKNFKNGLS
jgi:hypothetical protein